MDIIDVAFSFSCTTLIVPIDLDIVNLDPETQEEEIFAVATEIAANDGIDTSRADADFLD